MIMMNKNKIIHMGLLVKTWLLSTKNLKLKLKQKKEEEMMTNKEKRNLFINQNKRKEDLTIEKSSNINH
jgi:hypothetical protein